MLLAILHLYYSIEITGFLYISLFLDFFIILLLLFIFYLFLFLRSQQKIEIRIIKIKTFEIIVNILRGDYRCTITVQNQRDILWPGRPQNIHHPVYVYGSFFHLE